MIQNNGDEYYIQWCHQIYDFYIFKIHCSLFYYFVSKALVECDSINPQHSSRHSTSPTQPTIVFCEFVKEIFVISLIENLALVSITYVPWNKFQRRTHFLTWWIMTTEKESWVRSFLFEFISLEICITMVLTVSERTNSGSILLQAREGYTEKELPRIEGTCEYILIYSTEIHNWLKNSLVLVPNKQI